MDLKVMLFPYDNYLSGLGTYLIEVSNALSQRGVQVFMLGFGVNTLINDKSENTLTAIDLGKEPRHIHYLIDPIPTWMKICKRISKITDKMSKNVDIFHANFPHSAAIFRNRPLVVTARDYPNHFIKKILVRLKVSSTPKNLFEAFWQAQYNILGTLGYSNADKIACITKSLFYDMQGKYGKKAHYLPPGISCSAYTKQLGIIKENPTVLFVASNLEAKKKNLKTLLNAIKFLSRENFQCFSVKLVGTHSSRMKKVINELSDKIGIHIEIQHLLARKYLKHTYETASIFVCPSIYEQFGYVVLEAMSHGLPVLASNIHSFRDLVSNGRNGYLLQPTNHIALARRIRELIEDDNLRSRMGSESYEIVKNHFSWRTLADRYIGLYKSMIGD